MDQRVCIIHGLRTPFAKAGTALRNVPAYELGRTVVTELIDRVDHPELQVDALVMGNIASPAESSNIARVIALQSGLPKTMPAYSVNMNCASALLSIAEGARLIQTGEASTVVAGGTESMSNIPLHYPKSMSTFLEKLMRARTPWAKLAALSQFRLSHLKPIITLAVGLTDPVSGLNMGETAEVIAKRYDISRQEQDQYALRSHQRYTAAEQAGFYLDHRMPYFIGPRYIKSLAEDIGPRPQQSLEALQKLRPFFDQKFGTVTAGNSCPITDGAAACLLMSEDRARALGFEPEFFIRGYGFQGLSPEIMGLGPAVSTPIALRRAGVAMNDVELVEINEAFAAQVLANQKVFGDKELYCDLTGESTSPLQAIPDDILNVNGGAIALGHPVGTSGTRIVQNLYHEMKRRDLNLGLATLCVGGGLGGAMIIERA